MDILIRDLNRTTVKRIDEKAKKLNQSRQEFMQNLIENFIMMQALNEREHELKTTLEKNTEVLTAFQEQLEKQQELFHLLLED